MSSDDKESFVWHVCVKDATSDINSQELHSGKTPSVTLCYCFEASLFSLHVIAHSLSVALEKRISHEANPARPNLIPLIFFPYAC